MPDRLELHKRQDSSRRDILFEAMNPLEILCALRQNHRDREAAKAVIKYRDKGVVGFDIAGPEDGYPPTNQLQTFEYLRRENAHFTIHAGEAYGLASIWEAIQYCGAERLGHGVRIIDDIDFSGDTPQLGRLASFVRDRRIPLEICPTSNLQTGAAKTMKEHPIGKLAELRLMPDRLELHKRQDSSRRDILFEAMNPLEILCSCDT